jgi:hypothetical protein
MSSSDERLQDASAYKAALWLFRAACGLGAVWLVTLSVVRHMNLGVFLLWLVCALLGAASIVFLYRSGVRAHDPADRDRARRFVEEACWRSRAQ